MLVGDKFLLFPFSTMHCRSGADVNALDAWKQTPLCDALRDHNTEVIEYLLAHGAHPSETVYVMEWRRDRRFTSLNVKI